MHKHCLWLSALVLLLCSCTATSVKKTWKSPEFAGKGLTKFAVIAIADRGIVREGCENRLATQLRNRGASAVTTFDLLSLADIKGDKAAAAEKFRAAGCEAVLILRLVDASSTYREVRPGGERYAETITGIETGIWYDYYSVAYMDMSPTYGNLKQKVLLEAVVFDLGSAKRLWSGLTQTVSTETMDRAAEVDTIVGKIVAAMQRDGILR